MANEELTDNEKKRMLYYTTVYAQCFSPCGRYLAAGNNYGRIALFSTSDLQSPSAECIQDETWKYPVFTFQGLEGIIYALIATDKFLICAGCGDICAWAWSDLNKKSAKLAWFLRVPHQESFDKPEINALALCQKNESQVLFAGCGDNFVHMWDLENGTHTGKLQGHVDYIHCLAVSSSGNECVSGGEDGKVLYWDTRRNKEAVHCLEPFKNEACNRSKYGKWIGCVAVDSAEDWLLCGGGPSLSLWHLRSLSPVTNFPTPQSCPTWTTFHDDVVLGCGTESNVYQWSFGGDLKSKVPTSAAFLYSAAVLDNSQTKLLSVGGTSSKIDICTNFMYKDYELHFS